MKVFSARAEPRRSSRDRLALKCATVALLGPLAGCAPRTAPPDPAIPAMPAVAATTPGVTATLPVANGSTRVATLLDSGTIRLHYIEHAIGSESYTLHHDGDVLILADTFRFVDRGGEVALGTTLSMTTELEPRHFRTRGQTYRFTRLDDDIIVRDGSAHIRTTIDSATVRLPDRFFTVHGYAPFMVQALLVRYWEQHGRPARLTTIPGEPVAHVAIEFRGIDTLRTGARTVRLRRYSVSNVAWGREALWLDEDSRFAAALSRASLLPFEGVREDLADLLPALQRSAVRDRMADLARMANSLPPLASGTFAITGANLIDGTGATALADAVILVHDGTIVAAGTPDSVTLPAGVPRFAVDGRTVIPGLWDMHGHFGQIEWGPALLAAGITTGRDMGGESEFLIPFRDALRDGQGIGPQLLLAGLVDGSGPAAFGSTWADSPDDGVAVVDRFHAAGFDQIKLYTLLEPTVVRAIISRAHALGMTVTGHIPRALTLEQAVTMGLDHVAHLPISGDPADSETQRIIALLADHGTVIDPVLSWGELLSRSSETPIESFQPGFAHAPWPVRAVYGSVRNETPPETVAARRQRGLDIVRALHNAGVPIVAGTDDGVPGHSLHRELELYVEAGMTPMAALRAATAVPASAMGMADRVGTIEAGRRADLLILDGNPLNDIANIRTGRWVVANGRLYETAALWRMADFGN
jgi:imidazolonepropionase-like amidohydrolase